MILKPVLEISRYMKEGENVFLDGYLLANISINDRMVVLENVDRKYFISNLVNKEYFRINQDIKYVEISTEDMHHFSENYSVDRKYLCINHDIKYIEVLLKKIYAYGMYFDRLDKGMSTRLECKCNFNQLNDYILFAILDNA